MRFILITLAILPFMATNSALSAESAYVQKQHFMPIPPTIKKSSLQNTVVSQPAKFFPLTQSRFNMPIRNSVNRDTKSSMVAKEELSPPKPVKTTYSNKEGMSQEQAQQILSIFTATK